MSQIDKDDIIPINGPARFAFTLGELPEVSLSDWPPEHINPAVWNSGLAEINRHWNILKQKRIWTPYPILSFSVGSSSGPAPSEALSVIEQIARESVDGKDADKLNKVSVRFFLFPTEAPAYQGQTVAQVVCETCTGAGIGDVKMWVDALREDELSEENIMELKSASRAFSIKENIKNIDRLAELYPSRIKWIRSEEDVSNIDMDKVMAGRYQDFDNADANLVNYISSRIAEGMNIVILPAGKTRVMVLAANR